MSLIFFSNSMNLWLTENRNLIKKIFFILLSLVCFMQVRGQVSFANIDTVILDINEINRIENIPYFKWDTIITYDTKGLQNRFIQSYDNAANKISRLTQKPKNNTWWNVSRASYTYDNSGKLLTSIFEEFRNNSWIPTNKSTLTYDNNSNILTKFYETWYYSGSVSSQKYTYTYVTAKCKKTDDSTKIEK